MSSTKRPAGSSASAPDPKRANLGNWLSITAPKPPSPIVNSPPFTDRRSTFVAHAAPISTAHGAVQFQDYVRQLRSKNHPREADHEMLGWRCMSLKVGKDGLGGENDWTTKTGSDDDGEKGGGAQVRKSVEEGGGVDIAVVVSRWYGGIMLGQDRFRFIHNVTVQAVALLEAALALPTLLTRLCELDDEITALSPPTSSSKPPPPPIDYAKQNLDVGKAERLIKAREKRLELLQKKAKEEEDKAIEELEKEMGGGEEAAGAEESKSENEQAEDGVGDEDWEAAAAEVQALMDGA